MKRSFSTLACMELTFDQLLDCARKNGMQGIEIRLDPAQKICGHGIEQAEYIRKRCAETGITITDLATGVSVTDYAEGLMETAQACVDMAEAAACRAIRIFVGAHVATFDAEPRQNVDGIIRFVSELCDYAAPKQVEIWLETHSVFSTGKSIAGLLDAIDRPNAKALWDFIHSIEFRESPAESVAALGDRIVHVHFKDGRYSGDPNKTQYIHTKLGEGEMPLAEVMHLLREMHYDGFLSLEWELPWRPELKGAYADTDETLQAYNHWLDSVQ